MKRYVIDEGVDVRTLLGVRGPALYEANMKKTIKKAVEETVNPVKDAFEAAAAKYRGSLSSGGFRDEFYAAELMEPGDYPETVTENGETLDEVISGIDAELGTADRTPELFRILYGNFATHTRMAAGVSTSMYFSSLGNARMAAEEVSGRLCCNMYVFCYTLDHYDEDGYPLYRIDTDAVFYNGRRIDGITEDSYIWRYM